MAISRNDPNGSPFPAGDDKAVALAAGPNVLDFARARRCEIGLLGPTGAREFAIAVERAASGGRSRGTTLARESRVGWQ